ncbi:efflux RND transporter periplasmic adaptor subunit [Thioalkalivibrio sp. XN279]|uniref:efflux RND transporter periplasmic adaptor subunit n=1 Tax=Thioalkalivibrio sp. XN279 TaxID=2714953 RepID=UPI001407AC88|nr:efflux RND transporter periplasmic adaptor subunit [Thioalkalivibrio sp. XN279]NHA13800.1 efflux RND transporter periplasmic adaptor subunit [Thioalkalivibrio sp. XN279]
MDKAELLQQLKIERDEPAQAGARTGRWVAAILVLLAVAAAATYFLVFAPDEAVAVRVAAVQAPQSNATRSVLDATGYVTARRIATVSAQVTGQVETVLIEEGMEVEEGQVLATLDDTEWRAQVALAEAQLDSARSQLAEIRAQLQQAEKDLARQQELVGRGLTSQAALDAAATQVEALAARLESAATGVEVGQRSLELSRVRLGNTVIRAPFAGIVTVKAAQPGEMISPVSAGGGFTRTGIGTIVDMDSLEVQVDVNESFIQRVYPGQPVEAVLNAYPNWRIPAEVIAIIPTADRSRATVRVRVAILERDARIVPDMGVRVAFLSADEPAAPNAPSRLLVPAAALVDADGDSHVFVLQGENVVRRQVEVGEARGEFRQVLEGLRSGERVVLDPPAGLEDGSMVRVE